MFPDWRWHPDPGAYYAEGELWDEPEEVDFEEQEFMDAFYALLDMSPEALRAYAGDAWDAEPMEV